MPLLDIIWVLLGLYLYITHSIVLYAEGKHSKHRSRLLHILLDERNPKRHLNHGYMPTTKRTSSRAGPLNTGDLSELQECCPSITQGIAPLGGLARDGSLLQLFRDANTVQKFYETSCAPGVHNNPCRFINQTAWYSRCEQKYTYTYAIVKDFNVTQPYRIDYMKIKSGCSCTVHVQNQPEVRPKDLTEEFFMNVQQ